MIQISKPVIGEDEIRGVVDVLRSGQIAQGEVVAQFERNFSRYVGTKYSVAVNSGTAALHLSLLAQGIGYGDEVITTPFSFIATANSILYCNAKPVFVDVSEEDFNIDSAKIEEKINPKTKAIVIVHLYGQPCNMKRILDICDEHNLVLVEDACQAHGAEFGGQKVGSFGIGCFSFYPTKNMTTGEGGMITTNDQEVAEKAGILRDHGSRKKYLHEVLGYNYRMTDIAAVVGVKQLEKLDAFNKERIFNAKYLTKNLKNVKGIITPKMFSERGHVFHQYTIRVTDDFSINRDELVDVLNSRGIGCGIYYPVPINKQAVYVDICRCACPVSERLSGEVISLPVHPSLNEADLDKIVEVIKNVGG